MGITLGTCRAVVDGVVVLEDVGEGGGESDGSLPLVRPSERGKDPSSHQIILSGRVDSEPASAISGYCGLP